VESSPAAPERFGPGPQLRLTRGELLAAAEADLALLEALESYGLVAAHRGTNVYDEEALLVTRTAAHLAGFGIEPRHLRAFRSSADREAGLVEQVAAPVRRQRGPEAAAHADEITREVAALCVQLHAALVKAALARDDR
jgi:hypothetical protein